MTDPDLLLAIDNGTQSLKALVFDPEGRLLARSAVVFDPPYHSPQPGWAELDPEDCWRSLCRACQQLWQDHDIDSGRIAGVGLTTQRATVVSVDSNGRPLRPAIHWLDQRRTHGLQPLSGPWAALFRVAGLSDTVAYLQAEAESNWIRNYQPEVWKKTHKYLMLSGYLTYRILGEFVDSTGCQVGYVPFDYRRQRWAPSWSWRWSCLKLAREWMPELKPPGSLLGTVSAQAAAATGIPKGTPMIAAAADKACEVIGAGCVHPSEANLSFGTTATINVTHNKYLEAIRLLPAYPAAIAGHHTMEVQVYRGYWMVNWFKQEFGHPERQLAEENGKDPESLLDQLAGDVPPGAMGLMLQPYWSPGVRHPGPDAKGAVVGFGDVHTRAHLYRSILEGIAYALREGGERIQKRTGVPVTYLKVSGGGSQSDTAMQLTADIFGLPAARPEIYECSGLGAAVDIAVGLGFHDDFPSAIGAMTRIGKVFEPDMATHEIYNELYSQVYKKMYKRLKPLYKKIRKITGYPR